MPLYLLLLAFAIPPLLHQTFDDGEAGWTVMGKSGSVHAAQQSFKAQLRVQGDRMELTVYTPFNTTAATLYAEGDRVTVRRVGRHTFEDLHQALFSQEPQPRSLKDLEEGIRQNVRARRARR